jgi:hypothetical protein
MDVMGEPVEQRTDWHQHRQIASPAVSKTGQPTPFIFNPSPSIALRSQQ